MRARGTSNSRRDIDLKLFGITVSESVRTKDWGFTKAALPRFHNGGGESGMLICHGFGGSPANMRCLYERAVEMGFTVAVPLLTGHAKTFADMEHSGYMDWRNDVDEAFSRLIDADCKRVSLCGLSMGALLMCDLAERKGSDRIAAQMLICPPVRMVHSLNISSRIAPIIPYVQTKDAFPSPDMEMYCGMATRKLADIRKLSESIMANPVSPHIRTLLIQAGRDNRVAPVTYSMLKKHIPHSEYIYMKEAPHGIPYSDSADELCGIFEDYFKTEVRQ